MNENQNNSTGEVLKKIRGGDIRRKLVYNEETGEFVIKNEDEQLEDGMQDVTNFAGEGFA